MKAGSAPHGRALFRRHDRASGLDIEPSRDLFERHRQRFGMGVLVAGAATVAQQPMESGDAPGVYRRVSAKARGGGEDQRQRLANLREQGGIGPLLSGLRGSSARSIRRSSDRASEKRLRLLVSCTARAA
jgi:hypothetical protein